MATDAKIAASVNLKWQGKLASTSYNLKVGEKVKLDYFIADEKGVKIDDVVAEFVIKHNDDSPSFSLADDTLLCLQPGRGMVWVRLKDNHQIKSQPTAIEVEPAEDADQGSNGENPPAELESPPEPPLVEATAESRVEGTTASEDDNITLHFISKGRPLVKKPRLFIGQERIFEIRAKTSADEIAKRADIIIKSFDSKQTEVKQQPGTGKGTMMVSCKALKEGDSKVVFEIRGKTKSLIIEQQTKEALSRSLRTASRSSKLSAQLRGVGNRALRAKSDLERKLGRERASTSSLTETRKQLQEQVGKLEANLAETRRSLEVAQGELTNSKRNHESTKGELDRATATISSLRSQITEKDESIGRMHTAKAGLEEENTSLARNLQAEKDKVAEKDREIQRLENLSSDLAEACEELEEENESLEAMVRDFTERHQQQLEGTSDE